MNEQDRKQIKIMQEDQDIQELFGMDSAEIVHIRLRALLRIIGRALSPKENQIRSLTEQLDDAQETIYQLQEDARKSQGGKEAMAQRILELQDEIDQINDNHEVQQDLDQE